MIFNPSFSVITLFYPNSIRHIIDILSIHERFGDETFKALKQIFGEERAVSEYSNLKKIIYEN